MTRIIMVNIRNLAGVPPIDLRHARLADLRQVAREHDPGQDRFAGGLALAVLVLPIVMITSIGGDPRRAPRAPRRRLGVGATRWEVTRDHVLPTAAPGILTGTVLSSPGPLGEAAPLLLVGAITGLLPETGHHRAVHGRPDAHLQLVRPARHARRRGDVVQRAAAAGLVLLVLVLFFNAVAILSA